MQVEINVPDGRISIQKWGTTISGCKTRLSIVLRAEPRDGAIELDRQEVRALAGALLASLDEGNGPV